MHNNYIIIGPQGSGKGTQAQLIAEKYGIAHISTGNIFREIRTQNTDLGKKVRQLIDNGMLVPDGIVNQIVLERLQKPDCIKGFILDGYPRNTLQAQFLEKKYSIDKAFLLEVSEKETINRMSARRVCSGCRADYNLIYIKPKKEGICDKCGGKLAQRDDDKPDAIRKRLEIYSNETRPVIGFYEKKNVLVRVNGEQPIKDVFAEIMKKIH